MASGVLAGHRALGVRERESVVPVGQVLTVVGELSWEPRGKHDGAGARSAAVRLDLSGAVHLLTITRPAVLCGAVAQLAPDCLLHTALNCLSSAGQGLML